MVVFGWFVDLKVVWEKPKFAHFPFLTSRCSRSRGTSGLVAILTFFGLICTLIGHMRMVCWLDLYGCVRSFLFCPLWTETFWEFSSGFESCESGIVSQCFQCSVAFCFHYGWAVFRLCPVCFVTSSVCFLDQYLILWDHRWPEISYVELTVLIDDISRLVESFTQSITQRWVALFVPFAIAMICRVSLVLVEAMASNDNAQCSYLYVCL